MAGSGHGWRRLVWCGLLTMAVGVAGSGCGLFSRTGTANQGPPTPPPPPLSLAITPAAGAAHVPVSTEIGLSVGHGQVSSVTVTKAGSATPLAGATRSDGSSWVPAAPLAYASSYTATVIATSPDRRQRQTRTTTFRTMAEPARQTGTGMYLFSGQTYGVGMPVVIEFDPPVPESARAGVQQRLFVTSTPSQPGVWHWASGSQVWYRPPVYWIPGTTISVRAALKGVPMGGGSYGDQDRSATVSIGPKVVMLVDNATKSMSVYRDDVFLRTMPVSLGKPSTPSSSGNMVVMSHDYSTIFDTTREGPGGYRVQVNYAMRLTWGGEFIHAAPWSVGEQGHVNVSHGCVNMSWENSKWLFGFTHIGDPVTVRGTEVKLVDGNGWTAWNQSWARYLQGSALPVPPALANWTPAPPVTPKPSASSNAPAAQPSPTG